MESYLVQNPLQKLRRLAPRSKCLYTFIFLSLCAFYLIMENYMFPSRNTFNNGIPNNFTSKDYVFPSLQLKKKQEKKIVLWTTFYGSPVWQNDIQIVFKSGCDQPCSVSSDKAHVAESDAVIFHILDLRNQRLPVYRASHQAWVAFTAEPLHLIHHVITDKALLPSYPSSVFNWTLSFRTDATVYAPYGHAEAMDPLESSKAQINLSSTIFAKTKTKMAYTIISNCHDKSGRLEYVKRLKELTSLDFYGGCGNLKCKSKACEEMLPSYRFAIVFENNNCKDYVTEKYWNALYRKNVPVVNWVSGQVPSDAPPNSYINIHDFKSVKELAIYLTNLSANESEYNKYFEWKKTHKLVHGAKVWDMFCYLCKALHNNSIPAETVNFRRWYTDDIPTCKVG